MDYEHHIPIAEEYKSKLEALIFKGLVGRIAEMTGHQLQPNELAYMDVAKDKNLGSVIAEYPKLSYFMLMYRYKGGTDNADETELHEHLKEKNDLSTFAERERSKIDRAVLALEHLAYLRAALVLEFHLGNKDIVEVARDNFLIFLENELVNFEIEIPRRYAKLLNNQRRNELDAIREEASREAYDRGYLELGLYSDKFFDSEAEAVEDMIQQSAQGGYEYHLAETPKFTTDMVPRYKPSKPTSMDVEVPSIKINDGSGLREVTLPIQIDLPWDKHEERDGLIRELLELIEKFPDPRTFFDQMMGIDSGHLPFDKTANTGN